MKPSPRATAPAVDGELTRYLPPVYSAITRQALVAGVRSLLQPDQARNDAEEALRACFPGRSVLLTGSGTGALTLALQHAAPPGGTVALPAYACPDLGTAAIGAGLRVRLYDVDPHTLGPDWDSLDAALDGSDLVVGAHVLGRMVDIAELERRANRVGAVVIEDAAQFAGGSLRGRSGGALTRWSTLSFGRGKGLNAGGGGALLMEGNTLPPFALAPATGALPHLLKSAVSECLAQPALYGFPARIPALGVGETVYHAPATPTEISPVAAALLPAALRALPHEAADRRRNEEIYAAALYNVNHLKCCEPVSGSISGALRFPVLARPAHLAPLRKLGVVRAYPRTLLEYPAIAANIVNGQAALPGAQELANSLHTLPTHGLITPHDRGQIIAAVVRPPVDGGNVSLGSASEAGERWSLPLSSFPDRDS